MVVELDGKVILFAISVWEDPERIIDDVVIVDLVFLLLRTQHRIHLYYYDGFIPTGYGVADFIHLFEVVLDLELNTLHQSAGLEHHIMTHCLE